MAAKGLGKGMGKGLGKGLDALISDEYKDENGNQERIKPDSYVKITKVEPNPNQPRKAFNEDALQELADSIKIHGMIQPIAVQDRGDHYEVIAGERRWRAARLAGLKEVPVRIFNFTEKEILEISLIENLQRENLNPIEEALAYKRLLEEFDMKQDDVAERVSKSRVAITNSIRLLKLCDDVQQMVINDMISSGHARALLAIDDPEKQYALAQRVFDEKLSVRDIEKYVKDLKKPPVKSLKSKDESLGFIYRDLEEKLKISLGTKVLIQAKDNEKGKIEIEYYSKEDLERLTDFFLEMSTKKED